MGWVILYFIGMLVTYAIKRYFSQFGPPEEPPPEDDLDYGYDKNRGRAFFYALWPVCLPLFLIIAFPDLVRFISIKLGIGNQD